MNKAEILTSALAGREEEILLYQINIDNYRLAISRIQKDYPDNEDLASFREELQARLQEERRQQLRAVIIRDVISSQISELTHP